MLQAWRAADSATPLAPGLPLDPIEKQKNVSGFELLLTSLGNDGRLIEEWTGRRGLVPAPEAAALPVVNALSSRLDVETVRDGVACRLEFERGRALGPMVRLGPVARRGTRVSFVADPEIFASTTPDPGRVRAYLRQLAAQHPGLTLTFQGELVR